MSTDSANKPREYKAQAIKVMEGLEAVRKRPAMYIGSTSTQGLHHLVYEVVDNSVDEALAGHCDTIKVILHNDGSASIEDNGRGIPTDIHPTEKVSAAEVALTKLHAGGKFDKDSYKFSGGLHGVGVSVVNALSEWLELTVYQDDKEFRQTYKRGKPVAPLKEIGPSLKRGTLVRFMPDKEIFQETTVFSFDTLSVRLRELAFLNKSLRITIIDERNEKKHEFFFEGGIVSFVQELNKKKSPLFPEVIYLDQSDEKYMFELALQYNDGYGEQLFSFVNNINTSEGGTHVSGFKSALTKVCNRRAQALQLLKGGDDSFSSDDVREGLVCVISMKIPEPQFEGQTKTKLGNSEIKGLVDSWTFGYLDSFFEENPAIVRKILQKAEIAKRAREAAKKARDLTRRKTVLESSVLPGKLADCTNEDPTQTELFIVEGDSAGGSAKQGRDRNNQAILPLKGKILNVEKARLDRILSNEEIKALIAAIGTGISDEFDINKARYHKIMLMTDADVDGAHIRTLLLTFFFRYMRSIIESGYLYIAQPPLYKAKIGKKEQYLKDDKALKQFLFDWAQEQTTLLTNGMAADQSTWSRLLRDVYQYDELITQISPRFKISYDQCNKLVQALRAIPWKEDGSLETLINNLKQTLEGYQIVIEEKRETAQVELEAETPFITFVVLSIRNIRWEVPLDFFRAPETKELVRRAELLKQLRKPWRLQMSDKEKFVEGADVMELVHAISAISKPFMNIQRYKGLGEMNPDQLWETSMDAKTRTILKVSIEDALEADRWFTTLMGDDVQGRKEYIEQYGQFVKNLDV